jgi:hypothetical protein
MRRESTPRARYIDMQAESLQSASGAELEAAAVRAHGGSSADGNSSLAAVIEGLVETAPSLEALRKHRLHLAAARLWRSHGHEIPDELLSDVRAAAVRAMLVRFILHKVRSAYEGPLILMKGAEVAAHYPVPSDRPLRDLDLLATDPVAAQRALIEAGFLQCGDPEAYRSAQHLPPLVWPGAPLVVEVHRRPSQPFWLAPVSAESIFRTAVPSALGVPGLLAPEPAAHAVLSIAHAWAHDPLGSAGHLLDAAALLASADRRRARSLARAWGWEGMWNTTLEAIDTVVGGKRRSLALKLWARHLLDVRERLVLEDHISRLAAPVSSLPAREVPRAVVYAFRDTAAPEHDEDWITQLRRSYLAIAHAFRSGSEHQQSLAWIGPRKKPRRPTSMKVRSPRSPDDERGRHAPRDARS